MSEPRKVLLLLSGPNLNLLGDREPDVYGTETLDEHVASATMAAAAHDLDVEHVQSNHEGVLVDAIHAARGRCAAIVINPGALTHYAWSLHDALAAFDGPVIELHLSNPAAHDEWRRLSVVAPVATATIAGLGGHGYPVAVAAVARLLAWTATRGLGGELPAMDVAGRIPRIRAGLAAIDGGCDALLVSHLTNVRYLTGFTGSAGLLAILGDGDAYLVTDGRYEEQAMDEVAAAGGPVEVRIGRTVARQREVVAAALARVVRLGLEADHVSWADQRRYEAAWFPETTLVATVGVVEELRGTKDDGEVARIEAAYAIADAALAEVVPMLDERPSEARFARALDDRIRDLGADDISFETIVASGPNGSRPHHSPDARTIERGDLVVIDFGALVDGYHSDMTRTVAVGGVDALSEEQRRMVDVVAEAQAAGVAAVAPGVQARAVDEACRAVIEAAGWGEAFVHGTGHGVGLDIHEDPRVSSTADAMLAPGHVVTVEPGVYLPGHGGVRIEDTVVVTPEGRRTLTRAPKS